MKLIACQKEAVEKILQKYNSGIRVVDFKAPTGSGKTFIISHLLSNIFLRKMLSEKIVVLLATISSAELPKQFFEKVKKYQMYLPFPSYKVEYKESPSKNNQKSKDYEVSLVAEENKLIIVGRSSFTKASIFVERGVFDQFLDQVKNEGYKLIYIRDEAHHGGLLDKTSSLKKDEQKFEARIQKVAHFVLRMTATMDPSHEQVVVTEESVKESNIDDQYLLKQNACLNSGLGSLSDEMTDIEFLKGAITKFKKIQKEYEELEKSSKEQVYIRPAVLIQVDSKTESNSATFEQDIKNIITELEKVNLSWVKYFGDKKDSNIRGDISLLKLSENSSPVDAIIFKIGPATGWDIPRACMLIQLRNVNSIVLNQQTLGRIKRNPMPRLVFHSITDKYYLYSNYQESTRKMNHYVLKKKHQKQKWIQGIIKIEKKNKNVVLKEYCKKVSNFLQKNKDFIQQQIEEEFQKDYLLYQPTEIKTDGTRKKVGGRRLYDAINLKNFLWEKKLTYNNLFNPITEKIKQITSANKIDPQDKFYFILIKYYMEKLNHFWKLTHDKHLKPQYLIKEVGILPESYNIWEDTYAGNTVDYKDVQKIYAYINSDNTKLWKQALDSTPEHHFMKRVIDYINDFYINQDSWGDKIQVWTKNPALFSNIFLHYLDEQSISKKMFVDFIFKVNNSYIYVEIKSATSDYDRDKTKNIVQAFKQYTQITNKNVVFSLVRVNLKNHPICEYENYSQIKNIGKKVKISKIIRVLAGDK